MKDVPRYKPVVPTPEEKDALDRVLSKLSLDPKIQSDQNQDKTSPDISTTV